MKNYLLLAALSGIFFASCNKDYTCTCTVPASGSQAEAVYKYELKDVKKSRAKGACLAAGDAWILAGGKCELEKQ